MANQFDMKWNNLVHPVQQNTTKHHVRKRFGPYDILCGRSKLARNHIGNKHFRHAIRNRLQTYLDAPTKGEKSEVIDQIVSIIKRKSGKFWKYEKEKNGTFITWIELDTQQTRDKVAHVFRDMVSAVRRKCARQSDSKRDTLIEVDDQSIASLSTSKTSAESPDVAKMKKKTDQHFTATDGLTDVSPVKNNKIDQHFTATPDGLTDVSPVKNNKIDQHFTATPDGFTDVSPVKPSTMCTFPSTGRNIRRIVGTNHIGNCTLRREAHLETHFSRSPTTNPEHKTQCNSESGYIVEIDDPYIACRDMVSIKNTFGVDKQSTAGRDMVPASRRHDRMRSNNESDTILEVDDQSSTCNDMVWAMRRKDRMPSNNQNDSIIEFDDQFIDFPKHKTRQTSTVPSAGLSAMPRTTITTTVTTVIPNNDSSYIGNAIPHHKRYTGEFFLPSRAINPEHTSPMQFDHMMRPDISGMFPSQTFSRQMFPSCDREEPSQTMFARHQAVPVRQQAVRRTETVTKTFVVIGQTSMHSFSS